MNKDTQEKKPFSVLTVDFGGKKITKLQYFGFDMTCPFKNRILQQNTVGTGYSFVSQECSSMCPHFEYIKDQAAVTISCGSGRLIDVK